MTRWASGQSWINAYDTATGNLIGKSPHYAGSIKWLVVAADHLAHFWDTRGVIRVWMMPVCDPLLTARVTGQRITAICFSPDDRSLYAASSDGELKEVDAAALATARTPDQVVRALAYVMRGELID